MSESFEIEESTDCGDPELKVVGSDEEAPPEDSVKDRDFEVTKIGFVSRSSNAAVSFMN